MPTPTFASPGPHEARSHSPARLLRSLGIIGWDHLEPAVLAALASEAPLLVIGPHGSAKTMLLARLAAALGLEHRHYNASLLNFDDLVGFPVPDNGRLVYLQTPSTIWDAESVFFDEVSRCRPDLQNKLFPIVHDRIVQGVPLARLRHRWAAMNPPPAEESAAASEETPEYIGAEPLDVALADRFAFIVQAPGLGELGADDQLAVLRGQGQPQEHAIADLAAIVDDARGHLDEARHDLGDAAAQYVQLLAQKLGEAGHPISTRRAVQLAANIVSLRAVAIAVDPWSGIEDAFFAAARFSLPDAAWGRRPGPGKIFAAHQAAWAIARLAAGSPLKAILSEADPIRRIARALWSSLDGLEVGRILADTWSGLPRPARLATAAAFMPRISERTDLPAATVEPVASEFALLATRGSTALTIRRGGQDWKRSVVGQQLTALDRKTRRGRELTNAAIVLMAAEEPFAFDDLVAAYDRARDAAKVAGGAA